MTDPAGESEDDEAVQPRMSLAELGGELRRDVGEQAESQPGTGEDVEKVEKASIRGSTVRQLPQSAAISPAI